MTKTNWTKGSQMIDLEKMKLQAYRGSFTSGQALDLIEAYEALQSRLESLEKDAASREDVARAIWNVMREYEDRCDMELEDMGVKHPIWEYADAAMQARKGASE